MKRRYVLLAVGACLNMAALATAQQQPPPESPQRIDAKKEVVVTWKLGDQAWDFKDIFSAYDPVKGYMEPRGVQGTLAVWKLRLAKDFEAGAADLHEKMRGTPFKIVLLDAERTVINPDLPAQITVLSGKMDDTIELYVALPEAPLLKEVKLVRVQRRTEVGF
jgi:hypothetical protein